LGDDIFHLVESILKVSAELVILMLIRKYFKNMKLFVLNLDTRWHSLTNAHQIFWGMAIISSVLFLIQFVLSLIGADFDGDADFDVNADVESDYSIDPSFTVFSVRSIIAFLTFFSWAGVLVLNDGGSVSKALLSGLGAGSLALLIVSYMMWQFAKLTYSGTMKLTDTIEQRGEVYLPIPEGKNGAGKVNLVVDGALKELNAVTEGKSLPTGTKIRVLDVLDKNILLVIKDE